MQRRPIARYVCLRFSALQRAEIAEIGIGMLTGCTQLSCFSALQRAEIAEMLMKRWLDAQGECFSALQRAEIAEIRLWRCTTLMQSSFQCSSTSRNC